MRRIWPWLVPLVILALLAGATGFVISLSRSGLPQTEGSLSVGVGSTVEIYRDRYGTPHIIASNVKDLYFAQGYAQAQDRLWQMDLGRRGAGGRLAAIFGEELADTDRFTLTVGFLRAAENNYRLLETDTLAQLEAFSAGVNAFIDEYRNNLPPEFALIGYSPDPWTPLDSLLIGVYMSWYLGGNMQTELFHLALIEQVGMEAAGEIFPDYPGYGPTVVPATTRAAIAPGRGNAESLVRLSHLAEIEGRTRYVPGIGSNNWVISGDLTPGKGAFLANDMHLAMGLPSIWHQVHLVVEDEFNVSGAVFPGVPGIIVGFNEHIAWGVTNTGPDVQDLYLLELNPSNPRQYRYLGEWVDGEVVTEKYLVKGEDEPRELEVLVTRFGPEIGGVMEDLDLAIALRWTALDGTREFAAFSDLKRARNWEEFKEALDNFMSPTQNFVYADREGNIGFRANGLIPIRRGGKGLFPADGTTDEFEWVGFIPYDELPTLYNPPEGIIVTANHRVSGEDYPYFITDQWAPPYRAMGILRELEGRDIITMEDMIRAQNSFYNTQAETLAPVLETALRETDLDRPEEEVLEIFAAWLKNPVENTDEIGPSIYNTMYLKLLEHTFADEMGDELFERFLHNRASSNAFDRMLLNGESGWFNNINTAPQETRDDIIVAAFREATAYLFERLGSDPARWQWGRLHTITLEHEVGSVKVLGRFYNRGPYPVGGSFHTPANMSYILTEPFAVTHSAPWRYMVDMNGPTAFDILAGGSSGHPLSSHYDDQVEQWLAGEYREIVFDPAAVRELPEKLVLNPE